MRLTDKINAQTERLNLESWKFGKNTSYNLDVLHERNFEIFSPEGSTRIGIENYTTSCHISRVILGRSVKFQKKSILKK